MQGALPRVRLPPYTGRVFPIRCPPAGVCLAGALLSAALGCGGDEPARPPVVVVTPPPVRTVVARPAPIEPLKPGTFAILELQLAQGGTLDVTVDWTFADSWIYVYLGRTSCSYAELSQRACPFLVASETQQPKPRLLRSEPVEPGTYYVVLNNVARDNRAGIGSDNVESATIEVGLTVSSAGG